MIDPIADWENPVPEMLYRQARESGYRIEQKTAQDYRIKNHDLLDGLRGFRSPSFKRYSTESFFCNPSCLTTDKGGYPIYFDSGHLTLKGAEILRPLAQQVFSDMEKIIICAKPKSSIRLIQSAFDR